MWWKIGRSLVGMLVLALPTMALEGTAGADERETYYLTEVWGHPIEPYAELPNELNGGSPSTVVELQRAPLPIHCEAIAALVDPSTLGDGVAVIVSEGRYRNPSKAWAHNPEDSLQSKSEVASFPNGPRAYAECPKDTAGVAQATWGRYLSANLSVESASSDSTMTKLPDENLIVSETTNKLHGVKIGEFSIASIMSWMKAEYRPGVEPTVSYLLQFSGMRNGKALSGANEKGLVLQGENLVGEDFITQFNKQAKANEKAFEQIATYGFRIGEARFTRNQRSFADRGGSVYGYFYEISALDGKLQPTARHNQGVGHGFGMRIGVSRTAGDYEFYGG